MVYPTYHRISLFISIIFHFPLSVMAYIRNPWSSLDILASTWSGWLHCRFQFWVCAFYFYFLFHWLNSLASKTSAPFFSSTPLWNFSLRSWAFLISWNAQMHPPAVYWVSLGSLVWVFPQYLIIFFIQRCFSEELLCLLEVSYFLFFHVSHVPTPSLHG